MKPNRGFTLIELLIVIAIVGTLSTVVLVSLNSARAKARDSQRISSIKQVQTALALYQADNGSYPISAGSNWMGYISDYGSYSTTGAGGYIPNLAPTYIKELPIDPNSTASNGYLYKSNGSDYAFVSHGTIEGTPPSSLALPSNPSDMAVYTPGFADVVITSGMTQLSTPTSNAPSGSTTMSIYLYADAGATIYYTTNGSIPTSSSSVYSGIVSIAPDSITTVKAFAIKQGYIDSGIFTATYIGPTSCFLPGTLVKTTNGEVPIENIIPGQPLLSFNNKEQIVTSYVLKNYKSERDYYYTIRTANSSVNVTAEHPFYVGNGVFKQTQLLKAGDRLFILSNGKLKPEIIISIKRINSHTDVYNLSVTNPNTFFANSYAVHNKPIMPS